MHPPLRSGPWTFEGLLDADLPDDLSVYEVVDGGLVVRPQMSVLQDEAKNDVVAQLAPQLPPGWKAVVEAGIRLGTDGRRPDAAVVRAATPVHRRQMGRFTRDFALVIEVVSPSSRKTDMLFKPLEYAEAGVPAFWRIETEPVARLVVLRLVDGAYEQVQELTGRGRVEVPFPLEIDVPALLPPLLD